MAAVPNLKSILLERTGKLHSSELNQAKHSKRLKVRSQVQLIEGILLISRNKQRTKTTKSCLEQMPSLM